MPENAPKRHTCFARASCAAVAKGSEFAMPFFESKNWTPVRITGVFRLAALTITMLGVLWMASTLWFILTAEKGEATVVDWKTSTSSSRGQDGFTKRSTSYSAIVEYQAKTGGRHRTTSSRAFNHRKWPDGARVPVYYDAQDLDDILIDDAELLWSGPAAITGFGLFGLVLTSVILRVMARTALRDKREVEEIYRRHIAKDRS